MAIDTIIEGTAQTGQKRRLVLSIILIVVGLHIAAGVIAGIFVVARYFTPPPAQFEVRKDVRMPAKEREHKMNMAEFDAMTPKPSFNDTLSSLRPTDFALPDLPNVPMDQMLPLDPSAIVSDAVSSLVGTAGLGDGGQAGAGLGGAGEGFSFMGVQANGRRIALLFDVSGSVVNKAARSGVPMEKIKEETKKLIESLGINTRFGLVQFVRNYKPFRQELVPATDQNKSAAMDWIENEWSESGTMSARGRGVISRYPNGIEMVLSDVFKLEPDVVFLVSDGSFWKTLGPESERRESNQEKVDYRALRRLIGDLQKQLPSKATIHMVGFEMIPEEKRELSSIIRSNNGRLREIGAD